MSRLYCDGDITPDPNNLVNAVCSGDWMVETGGPFDPSILDTGAVVDAISSGFIVAGVPFLVVAVCRILLRPLKNRYF